jgi:hypothetical protein
VKVVTVKADDGVDVSDGYHTFAELYEHRFELYLALARMIAAAGPTPIVFRATKHHDGGGYDGWFMLGIGSTPGQQITYHLPGRLWDRAEFAETFERAPVPFDGHSSTDVLARLRDISQSDEPSRCNCNPADNTGGGHSGTCPEFEPECTCYELTGGHQPGCYFNRRPVR